MAKSSKSQNPEFLEKRRRAIAELAKQRGQKRAVASVTASSQVATKVASKVAKIIPPVAFSVRAQPQN
ncbi:MAG TPA: hypothetical protein VIG29_00135 [Vicinamibacteria bacterium]|jgi:hypothetical protein